jgi:group I intron endonuclease
MAFPNNSFGLVYLLTNLINGKQYVGQTVQGLNRRWQQHKQLAATGRGHLIASAIRKYGSANFRIVELARAESLAELNVLEALYVAGLNALSPRGYNLDSGGRNGIKSAETRAKIGAQKKGKKNGPLPPRTAEHCRNISLAKKGKPGWMRGKKWSDESRAKLRESIKDRPGHPHTEEFKARLRERNRGNTYALGYRQPPEHVEMRVASSVETRRRNAARS